MDLITVIIPTYNRMAKVPDAVRSVLDQTWKNLEIIVVDDGSTDGTKESLKVFKDSIRYFRTENQGVSSARNYGLGNANGKWVAFLDSDDSWHPEKLEVQMDCLRVDSSKVCFCGSKDEAGTVLDDLQKMDSSLARGIGKAYPVGDCRLFKYPRHPFLQSMIVERSLLNRAGGFDVSLRVAEDTKLIYRLVIENGFSVVNQGMVTICRDRTEPGLSDTLDPVSAMRRYDCYARVQSEFFPRLIPLDRKAASIVRKNMYYFISRLAEIACALGEEDVARNYAMAGVSSRAGWKCNLRNLFLLAAYPVARKRFSSKWNSPVVGMISRNDEQKV